MTTFHELDGKPLPTEDAPSALRDWYERVFDVPIGRLSDGDLSRACRQELHLEHVVPVALARLRTDPTVGELYDGELASAVARIPRQLWMRSPGLRDRAVEVLAAARSIADADVAADIDRFLRFR